MSINVTIKIISLIYNFLQSINFPTSEMEETPGPLNVGSWRFLWQYNFIVLWEIFICVTTQALTVYLVTE